ELRSPAEYLEQPNLLPEGDTARWLVLCQIRSLVEREYAEVRRSWSPYSGEKPPKPRGDLADATPPVVMRFLMSLPQEHRFALLVDLVEAWGWLGADQALFESLRDVTGL